MGLTDRDAHSPTAEGIATEGAAAESATTEGPVAEGTAAEGPAAEPRELRGGFVPASGRIALALDERGIATCTFDHPPTRNALNTAALRDLNRALAAVAADPAARVVVLTGAGGVFSSGADRAELADPAAVETAAGLLSEILTRIEESPVPVVCRVNGPAFGAGLAIVAAADIAVAAPDAVFGFPEVRFGLVPGPAAAASLARIGQTAALDLLLTARRFNAPEAARLGLIATIASTNGNPPAPAVAAGDALDQASAADGALDPAATLGNNLAPAVTVGNDLSPVVAGGNALAPAVAAGDALDQASAVGGALGPAAVAGDALGPAAPTGKNLGPAVTPGNDLASTVAVGNALDPASSRGNGLGLAVAVGNDRGPAAAGGNDLDSAVAAVIGDLLAGDPAALRATRALIRGLAPAPLAARLASARAAAIA